MKLNWLTSLILKGVLVMVISGVAMLALEKPGVVDSFLDYMYLLLATAFCGGLLVLAIGVWEYFFGSSGRPNYVYRSNSQYILVRYSTSPFQIERNRVRVWVGMVLDAQLYHRQITLRETASRQGNFFKKNYFMGTDGDDIFVTEDGQRLNLTREIMGIRVWWDEIDNPWKIVME